MAARFQESTRPHLAILELSRLISLFLRVQEKGAAAPHTTRCTSLGKRCVKDDQATPVRMRHVLGWLQPAGGGKGMAIFDDFTSDVLIGLIRGTPK